MSEAVLCVDFGSTFTKACLVERGSGALLATASSPTTVSTDVLDGFDVVRSGCERTAGRRSDEVLACSSAGGGLRIAVVGYEELVTAEAGHRVALSAGGKVVHVASGRLDQAALTALAATALGRAWFGFALVLAFGIGMAASLAAVGLLARDVVNRIERLALQRGFLGGNVRTFLRYGAALGICAVGAGVVIRTLVQL